MGALHSLFLNASTHVAKRAQKGRYQFWPTSYTGRLSESDWADFAAYSGDVQGLIPDLLYTATTQNIYAAASSPKNGSAYARYGIRRFRMVVNGPTAWAGGTGIALTDTDSKPIAFAPLTALQPGAIIDFPYKGIVLPLRLSVSSFAAATGIITLPATSLQTTTLANNAYLYVESGTGAGQAAEIGSNTATTITPTLGATAFATPLDNTSKIAVCYWSASAGGATTATFASQQGSATPLTANQLGNGFQVASAFGTSAGQSRGAISNTTSAVTVNAWQTNPAAGDLFQFSTDPTQNGCVDLGIGQGTCPFDVGAGLQLVVLGAMTQGSPIRFDIEGKWVA